MKPVSEPISLEECRSYLSLNHDDTTADALLTESIAFCRDRLEAILPYYLAERTVCTTRNPLDGAPDQGYTLKGPVQEVTSVYVAMQDHTEQELTDYLVVRDRIYIPSVPDGWSEIAVEYTSGAHCPPVIRNALLMMVKNRYERRDEDPLTMAVMYAVYNETRLNA